MIDESELRALEDALGALDALDEAFVNVRQATRRLILLVRAQRGGAPPPPAPPAPPRPQVTAEAARARGFTGNVCRCGSMALLRTGTCETCQDCGHNVGCS